MAVCGCRATWRHTCWLGLLLSWQAAGCRGWWRSQYSNRMLTCWMVCVILAAARSMDMRMRFVGICMRC